MRRLAGSQKSVKTETELLSSALNRGQIFVPGDRNYFLVLVLVCTDNMQDHWLSLLGSWYSRVRNGIRLFADEMTPGVVGT